MIERIGNEHPAARPWMVCMYTLSVLVGAGGLVAYDFVVSQSHAGPFQLGLLRFAYIMYLLGGVFGIVGVLSRFWWVERGGAWFCLSASTALMVPLVVNETFWGLKVSNGSLLGIVIGVFIYRLVRIQGLYAEPTQSKTPSPPGTEQ